jgi:lysophospholipase L1-like esterase
MNRKFLSTNNYQLPTTMLRNFYLLLFILFSYTLTAQDPLRFEKEVNTLTAGDSVVNRKKLILFTGSSSIRVWNELKTDFPTYHVLNRGFGGSEMSDLLYFNQQLILNYKPVKIFIYEGDNDINSGKSAETILQDAEKLLASIRGNLPKKVKVYFISPKPSISRKHLRAQYEDYNQKLEAWCSCQKRVKFVDVWTPMLDAHGEFNADLFIEDNLHMNRKGYEIWKQVIEKFL